MQANPFTGRLRASGSRRSEGAAIVMLGFLLCAPENLVAHKNILLIQDDAVEAKAVSEALHGSFRVDWVR